MSVSFTPTKVAMIRSARLADRGQDRRRAARDLHALQPPFCLNRAVRSSGKRRDVLADYTDLIFTLVSCNISTVDVLKAAISYLDKLLELCGDIYHGTLEKDYRKLLKNLAVFLRENCDNPLVHQLISDFSPGYIGDDEGLEASIIRAKSLLEMLTEICSSSKNARLDKRLPRLVGHTGES